MYEGIDGLEPGDNGELLIRTPFGDIRESAPRVYQDIKGKRLAVAGAYAVARGQGNTTYGFRLGSYDPDYELVIDPTLEYSTYLGGTGYDEGLAIAVDLSGAVYVTGTTTSTNFPTEIPIYSKNAGGYDVFVTKVNPAGGMVYSTYLGGTPSSGSTNWDVGHAIAVDASGSAYITGETNAADFPTENAIYGGLSGGIANDAFVTKISPAGNALVYSTYLGGGYYDYGYGIAVDNAGNAYVTGSTNSTNFPTVNAIDATLNLWGNGSAGDVFVTKINAAGDGLVYSTYVGGNSYDNGYAIDVDSVGNAYVTGSTNSNEFPAVNALFPARVGADDAFVLKIDPAGDALIYSTYLGGTNSEVGYGIAADSAGNAYVTGSLWSTDYPTVNPIFAANAGGRDAFVTKIAANGASLLYSTYLGGASTEYAYAIAVDPSGNAYVTGETDSTTFPTKDPLYAANAGGRDVFVTKINPAGSALVYSTYLGGSNHDIGYGIAVDASKNAYVTGFTSSVNFPTRNPLQPAYAGSDAFVAKIASAVADLALTNTDSPDPVTVSNTLTYTITVTNNGPDTATDVVLTDTLPSSVTFESATPSAGSCSHAAGAVTCHFTSIPAGDHTTATIAVVPTAPASALPNHATVAAKEHDPSATNNSATAATVVNPATDLAPDIAVAPLSHDFGETPVGTSSTPKLIDISNTGNAALSVGDLALGGADSTQFAVENDGCSQHVLPIAGACTVTVVFAPISEGAKNASLSIPSNDPDENPVVVTLAGFATPQAGSDYTVHLHSRVFVPPPGLPTLTRDHILGSGLSRVHVLVQAKRMPTSQDRNELAAAGLRLLIHIPNLAWFASLPATPSAVDQIATHPAVRSITDILPGDRIAGNVKDGIDPRLQYPDGRMALEASSFFDVPPSDARSALVAGGAEILAESSGIHTFLVRLLPSSVAALAQSDLLQFISEVAPPPLDDNDQVRLATRASNVQILTDTVDAAGNMTGTQPGLSYSLDGSGVLIGQWEGRHPDCSHPDFAGTLDAAGNISGSSPRVVFGDTNTDCRSQSYSPAGDATLGDHATHVAGIVLGNGSQSAAAGALAFQWRGMAPNASIRAYQAPSLDTNGDGVADAAPLAVHFGQYADATVAGAVLSTNSWGFTHCHQVAGSCYEPASAMYDELVTDRANPARTNALSIFGSAGNQGPAGLAGAASFSVRIPNSAKNTVVVGNINANTKSLAGSSSRGPVDDGRLKPEVVAPGDQAPGGDATRIRSTVMTITTDDANPTRSTQGAGCTSDGQGGNGIDDCGFPYDDIGGTSMSTPATAGAAALLVQQFRTGGSNPWPSTIKALLVHTAVDQCCTDSQGLDADTAGPDYAYGYGLIDVQGALDVLRNSRNGHVIEAAGFGGWGSCAADAAQACDYDGDGDSDDHVYTVHLPAGLPSFRVTLAYDDLPGAGGLLARGTSALDNDLDLFLVAPDGSINRPWTLNPNNPTNPATRGIDTLNPLEVVDVANPAGGDWTIVVRPTRLIPTDLDPAQRYSLVYKSFESDLMIRDHAGDDGGVPSARHEAGIGWTPARPWTSPDIVMEGGEVITPGVEKAVRVAVTNIGQSTVNDVVVNLYWANAGIGLDYADYLAHPMGSCTIARNRSGAAKPARRLPDHVYVGCQPADRG